MRWFAIACLVIVVGYGLNVWRSVQRSILISEAIIREAVPYEQHPAAPVMRILVAGDSTAVGVGGAPRESIAGRIGADMPQADIVNRGVSGARLTDIIPVLKEEEGKMYDLVVLQIGANDVTGRTPYDDIAARLDEALAAASSISRTIIIMTSGDVGSAPIFKWPLSTYLSARSMSVREIFMEQAARHPSTSYVDLYIEPAEDPFRREPDVHYASDHFHPSGVGYGVWFERVREHIR